MPDQVAKSGKMAHLIRRNSLAVSAQLRHLDDARRFISVKRVLLLLPWVDAVVHLALLGGAVAVAGSMSPPVAMAPCAITPVMRRASGGAMSGSGTSKRWPR